MKKRAAFIPYGYQTIAETDIDAVVEVLKSDFLTQGQQVPKFESAVADFCQAKYSLAVNSATSALHLACLALEVGSESRVWTSATTFVASANCALYCGADVDFLDIDSKTFNIDTNKLEKKLKQAKVKGLLPDVLIAVHLCGQPCDMARLFQLSTEYNFRIIEDAAHAIGSAYLGNKTGSCKYSDITIFSFHPVKIITTAEGGMALTNDEALDHKMRLLRSHGITREFDELENKDQGEWYYEQQDLGFNYRMTELQAALGSNQLKKLIPFIETRHKLASNYGKLLAELPLELPRVNEDSWTSFHLYVIRLDLNACKASHKEVFNALRAARIGVNLHYMPVYLQPYFQRDEISKGRFVKGYCPEAEAYAENAISIPLYPTLTLSDQERIAGELKRLLCH
jgi:UDP-4-amino-4,6-dideoxy-N-acetyl-beta-L-altrosamine transaminase